jgi:hypothetical protein
MILPRCIVPRGHLGELGNDEVNHTHDAHERHGFRLVLKSRNSFTADLSGLILYQERPRTTPLAPNEITYTHVS